MKSLKHKWTSTLLLTGGVAGLALGAGALAQSQNKTHDPVSQKDFAQAQDMASVFRDIGKRVEPSVVEIRVRKTLQQAVDTPDDSAPLQDPRDFLRRPKRPDSPPATSSPRWTASPSPPRPMPPNS